jgi:hypothetical protein
MSEAAEETELRQLPPGLWARLRADPARAPEHVALAAAAHHGPAARDWVAERRRTYTVSGTELAQMAKRRHASLARLGGAATGVGGFITVVPDLAATAWIQSRCVFFIAAAYGFDPLDPMRPAELLVLQQLYPDVAAARSALDGAGKHLMQAMAESKVSGADSDAVARRLAKAVGKSAVKRVGFRLVPGLAIAANAVGNERDTRALADRAIAFYGG